MSAYKVLIIHPVLWSHYKAKVLSELHEISKKENIEIKVLQIAANWEGGRKLGEPDRAMHRYPYKLLFEKYYEQVSLLERISSQSKELLSYRPAVLVLPGYSDLSHWFLLMFSKLFLKTGIIVIIDSTGKDRPRVFWKEKIKQVYVGLCDAAFCYGSASAEYTKKLGMRSESIYIRFQATDNDAIRSVFERAAATRESLIREYNAKSKNFVFVGRLSPEKNITVLLQAYKAVKTSTAGAEDWGLIIVGDGPQKAELESFVRENEIPDVLFVGAKSWRDVPVFYALADVFVLPSLSEPWGLVVNEAMLCGLPVIVSNKAGAAFSLVRDGGNGFKFDPENTAELAAIMRRFVAREVDAAAMGKQSLEMIKDYSPEMAASQMLYGIDKVFKSTGKRALRVVHFHRKPNVHNFSVEGLFDTVRDNLPSGIECRLAVSRFQSRGFFKRIYNIFEAALRQGDVNHITGDVHFLSLLMRKRRTIITVLDCVYTYNSSGIKRFLLWFFWYFLPLKKATIVTVISKATKAELLKHLNISPDKIRVVPCCISPVYKYSPKEFDPNAPRILLVGTSANKNLLRIFEAVKGISCSLDVVGQLSSVHLRELNLNKIQYSNSWNINAAQMLEKYRTCDLLAFVSTYEGFGMPILEANAVGRPVITSNILSMPEVAGDAAILVDPYSSEEIRKGILHLINDSSHRQQLIQRGLENVKRYSARKIAEEYAALYREVYSDSFTK